MKNHTREKKTKKNLINMNIFTFQNKFINSRRSYRDV
jgi:hypothetical protein